jgi:hypothetical protein
VAGAPTAELWHVAGLAYCHLWRPLEPATAADALEALNRSLRPDPGYEWARLHKIYVQYESDQLVGCLADARLLDRSWFVDLEPELAWRVISAYAIELACLVRLGIRTPRVRELYRSIVDLATPAGDDLWPYRPSIFAEAFELACSAGHFAESEVPALQAEVADLMTKVDAQRHTRDRPPDWRSARTSARSVGKCVPAAGPHEQQFGLKGASMADRREGGSSAITLLAFSFVITMLGGAILATTYVAPLPGPAVLAGLVLFAVGVVLAGIVGARDSRREGASFIVTVGQAFRTALGWARAFFP